MPDRFFGAPALRIGAADETPLDLRMLFRTIAVPLPCREFERLSSPRAGPGWLGSCMIDLGGSIISIDHYCCPSVSAFALSSRVELGGEGSVHYCLRLRRSPTGVSNT